MNEAGFTGEVIALALNLGALVHHCYSGKQCEGAGFPDLVIAGQYGVIFAELKSATGKTDPAQDGWAWILTRSSIYHRESRLKHVYFLWRPDDLRSGQIEGVIKQVI